MVSRTKESRKAGLVSSAHNRPSEIILTLEHRVEYQNSNCTVEMSLVGREHQADDKGIVLEDSVELGNET